MIANFLIFRGNVITHLTLESFTEIMMIKTLTYPKNIPGLLLRAY